MSYRWLPYTPFVTLILYIGVLIVALQGKLSHIDFFYGSRFFFELQVLVSLTLMFIPINLQVLRQEKIYPMRVRHFAIVSLWVMGTIYATLNVIGIPFIIITNHVNPLPHIVPRATLVALCLMVEIIPTRLISLSVIPFKIYLLYRVKRVEQKLSEYVPIQYEPIRRESLFRILELDMSTYQAVINILDNYDKLRLKGYGHIRVYKQLIVVLPRYTEYQDLVRAISRVNV